MSTITTQTCPFANNKQIGVFTHTACPMRVFMITVTENYDGQVVCPTEATHIRLITTCDIANSFD